MRFVQHLCDGLKGDAVVNGNLRKGFAVISARLDFFVLARMYLSSKDLGHRNVAPSVDQEHAADSLLATAVIAGDLLKSVAEAPALDDVGSAGERNASLQPPYAEGGAHVFGPRPRPEVLGVYAARVVTEVHHIHSGRYGAVRQSVRDAVRSGISAVLCDGAPAVNDPVPVIVAAPSPFPASIISTWLKPCLEADRKSVV